MLVSPMAMPVVAGVSASSSDSPPGALLGCCLATFMTYTIRPYAAAHGPSPAAANVCRASPLFGTEGAVMSPTPWFVLAYTDCPP